METIDVQKSVVDWVIDLPLSVDVFKQHGIDYCCAGKSQAYAWRQANASLPEVVLQLRELLERNCQGRKAEAKTVL
jgi:regulator of cell morphogenesis and NO signaling